MATHSSILARRIPGTEEPDGLQSTEPQRVRHDWVTNSFTFTLLITAVLGVEGLPLWLSGKESACIAGDLGCIPGLGRRPGGGHGNPFQYSCLGNLMDRGAWRATVHSNLLPPEGFEGGGMSQRTNSLLPHSAKTLRHSSWKETNWHRKAEFSTPGP